MWFNPNEISKNKPDCLATLATLRPSDEKIIETAIQKSLSSESRRGGRTEKWCVICYTPAGNPIEVEARDAEHAAWLKQMNPKRTL